MGKLILISGGNGSGKSRYAESLISRMKRPRYYLATMQPQTRENHQRIQKHIAQRAGLDFVTLELPYSVREAEIPEDSIVLLEDVSNLLANTLFAGRGHAEDVRQDILALAQRCGVVVAVTITGLLSQEYSGETAAYIDDLNWLNHQLFLQADGSARMVDRIAVWEKGKEDEVC